MFNKPKFWFSAIQHPDEEAANLSKPFLRNIMKSKIKIEPRIMKLYYLMATKMLKDFSKFSEKIMIGCQFDFLNLIKGFQWWPTPIIITPKTLEVLDTDEMMLYALSFCFEGSERTMNFVLDKNISLMLNYREWTWT